MEMWKFKAIIDSFADSESEAETKMWRDGLSADFCIRVVDRLFEKFSKEELREMVKIIHNEEG